MDGDVEANKVEVVEEKSGEGEDESTDEVDTVVKDWWTKYYAAVGKAVVSWIG